MKKILSTVAMAIVAFTAVVSMSSCQNDDPSSMNAAPQVPATTTQSTTTESKPKLDCYFYQFTLCNDVLKYFDIKVECTNGSDVKTYTLSNDATLDSLSAKQTEEINFQSTEKVSFKTTVTPKTNWKEIYEQSGEDELTLAFFVDCNYQGHDVDQGLDVDQNPTIRHLSPINDDTIQKIAEFLQNQSTVLDY